MYKIIGVDQKEYGPIAAEQLRFWIKEGRVNAQTQACLEGTADWKPLGAFPEFADAFGLTAASESSATIPTGTQMAAQSVKGPAIALIITAALGIVYYAFSGIYHFIGGGAMFHQEMPPNMPPQFRAFIEGMQGPMAGVVSLLIAALNVFILFGGIKFLRLKSYGFVMAACIAAMLPCQCCCLFGLPFGIWALVVLNKPEVKSQFE